MNSRCLVGLLLAFACLSLRAQTNDNSRAFLNFIKSQAATLRTNDEPPQSLAEWQRQNAALRANLLRAWGGFPAEPCPLQPRKLGELQRDGYRVEKIIFQTRPGVWMTANAYVPARSGKLAAVLCVHGHWRGAKQDPVVQSRCIGLAKLGFFVLVVDAFGAGERGVGKALGEYHGEMTAATLLPIGLSLSGLQVYENLRAVDYLLTRPEVDGARLGITGASGGGNQTMYSGAWDERFAAAVPVCSVGNYQAYLGTACCMCEVVPGALRFTEEGNVLGLTAPRALMVVNATKDGPQFSIPEARTSVSRAHGVFDFFGAATKLRHVTFESPHAYNQPMREAMYGWMAKHLNGEGDGSPVREPEIKTEEPEALRCFPGNSRPDDFVTIPRFAEREARQLVARQTPAGLATRKPKLLAALEREVLGGMPVDAPLNLLSGPAKQGRNLEFDSEPGVRLSAKCLSAGANPERAAVLLSFDDAEASAELVSELRAAGWTVVIPELRATGRSAWPRERIGRAPDHTSAEWALWIGRPMLGQWVCDVHRTLDAFAASHGGLPRDVAVIGKGPAGVIALCAGVLDSRITRVVTKDSLVSYVTDVPYQGQRLGIMVPGILRDVGDVPQIAALLAPRPLVIAGGVTGGGKSLGGAALEASFSFTRDVFGVQKTPAALKIFPASSLPSLVDLLR